MIYRVVIKSSHRPSVFRAPSLLDYKLVSEIACSSVDLGLSMLFAASLIVVLERKIVQRRAVGTYGARGTITPQILSEIEAKPSPSKTIGYTTCPLPPDFQIFLRYLN